MNLLAIFLTGLTTGALSCSAVQGGLLASVIANQKKKENSSQTGAQRAAQTFDLNDWLPVTVFLGTKLISHVILGFALGAFGSVLTLSLGVKLTFQTIAALFMLATAANLLQLHPAFRWVSIQSPRFLRRYITTSTRESTLWSPAVLGLLSIFIPCGVTQAMEVLAISSGNPWTGAAIMGTFVLGTSPVFAALGVLTSRLSETMHTHFTRATAVILIALSLYALNGVATVLNFPLNWSAVTSALTSTTSPANNANSLQDTDGVQRRTIQVLNRGYQPQRIQVQQNQPVELTLVSNETYSCALDFVLPAFGIRTMLRATDTQTFTFIPTQKGRYTYSCSMGMYTGTLEVI